MVIERLLAFRAGDLWITWNRISKAGQDI